MSKHAELNSADGTGRRQSQTVTMAQLEHRVFHLQKEQAKSQREEIQEELEFWQNEVEAQTAAMEELRKVYEERLLDERTLFQAQLQGERERSQRFLDRLTQQKKQYHEKWDPLPALLPPLRNSGNQLQKEVAAKATVRDRENERDFNSLFFDEDYYVAD